MTDKTFWDHFDGAYYRKSLPGIMVWRYQDEEIVLKCDLQNEIGKDGYATIFACVYPFAGAATVIPETPFKLRLRPDMGYHLIVIATKINDKQEVTRETWNVWFAPNQ